MNTVADRLNRRSISLRNNRNGKSFKFLFLAFIIVFIAVGLGFSIYSASQTGTVTNCVVTDKDRTTDSEGNSQHRVYTENCGTFSANDSLLDLKFTSADVYGAIKVGETYNFDTRGIRLPIISSFPNIVTATKSIR